MLQAAISLAVAGDLSVLRRELPRFERDEHLAPGAAPPSGLVTGRAYVQAADGKVDDAVAALQAIASDDPRQAATYFTIGQVQERGGRIDDAIASYPPGRRRCASVVDELDGLVAPALPSAACYSTRAILPVRTAQFDILRKQWEHADAGFIPAQQLKQISKH